MLYEDGHVLMVSYLYGVLPVNDLSEEQKEIAKAKIDTESKLLYVLGGVAALATVIAWAVYRMKFVGGLSDMQNKWSEFGGYFSGVLLPVISLLTLVAIIKTIFLQREMIRLQNETFKAQLKQSAVLTSDSCQAKIDARKTALLNSLDRTINTCIRDVERLASTKAETLRLIVSAGGVGLEPDSEISNSLNKLQENMDIIEARKNQLESLSYAMTVSMPSSIEELQDHFQSGMSRIYAELMT